MAQTHVLHQMALKITQYQIQGLSYLLPLNLILCRLILMNHVYYIYTSSNYWRKCLFIVFSLLLGESSGHKLGFVHLYEWSWGGYLSPSKLYLLLSWYLVGPPASPLVESYSPHDTARQFYMDLHPAKCHRTILISSWLLQ
jgi:hypothetical protein